MFRRCFWQFGQIEQEFFDGWMPYWETITVVNRKNNLLGNEFVEHGLEKEYDDNNIRVTQLKNLLERMKPSGSK